MNFLKVARKGTKATTLPEGHNIISSNNSNSWKNSDSNHTVETAPLNESDHSNTTRNHHPSRRHMDMGMHSKNHNIAPRAPREEIASHRASFALDMDLEEDSRHNPLSSLKERLSDLGHLNDRLWKAAMDSGSDSDDYDDEDDTEPDYQQEFEELHFTENDIISVLADDKAVRTLQRSLRNRYCSTNLYLQQTMHCYIRHVKEVRQRNSLRQQSSGGEENS
jgi:hypothetical protein